MKRAIHTATRPSAAFGILRNMKVEAVISDVVMPEMDGYEFYTRVKEEMPDLPVILMTAYYYDKDHIIKRSRMRGLEGAIFKKPVNPIRRLPAIRRRPPAPPAHRRLHHRRAVSPKHKPPSFRMDLKSLSCERGLPALTREEGARFAVGQIARG